MPGAAAAGGGRAPRPRPLLGHRSCSRRPLQRAAGPHSDDPTGPQARISASLAKDPDLWGRFRTPSLRNVAETPPYMHEGPEGDAGGRCALLRFAGGCHVAGPSPRIGAGPARGLSPAKQADLTAFLHMLTGTPPAAPWNAPPGPAVDRNGAADSRKGARNHISPPHPTRLALRRGRRVRLPHRGNSRPVSRRTGTAGHRRTRHRCTRCRGLHRPGARHRHRGPDAARPRW